MEKLPSEVVVVCIVCLAGLFILPLLCDVSTAEYKEYVRVQLSLQFCFFSLLGVVWMLPTQLMRLRLESRYR